MILCATRYDGMTAIESYSKDGRWDLVLELLNFRCGDAVYDPDSDRTFVKVPAWSGEAEGYKVRMAYCMSQYMS
jgi:hypothetical protein